MKKLLSFICMIAFLQSCTKSESENISARQTSSPSNTAAYADLIVGKWSLVEKGVLYNPSAICNGNNHDQITWQPIADLETIIFSKDGVFKSATKDDAVCKGAYSLEADGSFKTKTDCDVKENIHPIEDLNKSELVVNYLLQSQKVMLKYKRTN